MANFYTKKEWSKLFSDILTVAKKCNYFPRKKYNDQKKLREDIMNAYKESMYFAKAYPINDISTSLLTGFVSYAGTLNLSGDMYNHDFKAFLMELYSLSTPFFEKEHMEDKDWEILVGGVTKIGNSYKDKYTGEINPLFIRVGGTILDLFEHRERGAINE